MSKYVFTICGRAGSKGIPGKNSSVFLDIPLLYYTLGVIELYKAAHPEDDITLLLNTDSVDLKELMDASGLEYTFVPRSEELAGDSIGKVDVIRESYRSIKKDGEFYDAVVDFDLTSPLRTLNDLEYLLSKRNSSKTGVVFTVVSSRRNPYFNMVEQNPDGTCSKVIDFECTARQQAPNVYDMNASMYAYSIDFLEEEKQMFDEPCDFVEMYDTAILDLDHPDDLELMQVIATYLFKKNARMNDVRAAARSIEDLRLSRHASQSL